MPAIVGGRFASAIRLPIVGGCAASFDGMPEVVSPLNTDGPGDLSAATLTDRGRARADNEDRVFADVSRGLFIVADGMGGLRDGGRAAEVVIETVPLRLDANSITSPTEALAAAVRSADAAVIDEFEGRSPSGTTVVVALIDGGVLHLAHAGDSRAALLRDMSMRQLTVEHNLAALYVESGRITAEEARGHPASSRLTSYVGMGAELTVDVSSVELVPGDRLVLMTDGVPLMLSNADITAILVSAHGPSDAATALVEAANDAGGHDNIGVVVVDV